MRHGPKAVVQLSLAAASVLVVLSCSALVDDHASGHLDVASCESVQRGGARVPDVAVRSFVEAIVDGDRAQACSMIVRKWHLTSGVAMKVRRAIGGVEGSLSYRPVIEFADAGRVLVEGEGKRLLTVHVVRDGSRWYVKAGSCPDCASDGQSSLAGP